MINFFEIRLSQLKFSNISNLHYIFNVLAKGEMKESYKNDQNETLVFLNEHIP